MPELTDTHVHLDDSRLSADLAQVLARAADAGVTRMINIGHSLESSQASVQLAGAHGNIWCAIGIHPHSAKDMNEAVLGELRQLAFQPKVVAIGEIGLDYHYNFSPRDVQREVFARQMEMAVELSLPVVIHQREAAQDTLNILKLFAPLPHGGVMHCFSGSVEVMQLCLELNLHIGLGGAVTFKNSRKAKEVAAAVPLSRLVLETDCPYMAPHPHRGKVNQPGYLPLVASEIAALRAMTPANLASVCTENAVNLFSLTE